MAIEQWLVEQPKTIDIETVRTVRARLASGAFNVIGHDGPGCRVEVGAVDDRPIRIAIDGDTLVVDHPQWSWSELPAGARAVVSPPEATLTLLVPRRTELSIAAMGAEVLAVGVHGRISVRTLAGEVFLDETEGELAVQTVDGDINVREHTGALKVRTVSGHLTASGALREVDARTATGTVNLDVTSGLPDRLQTVTVSGATTIRLPRDANPAYRVKTVTALAQLDGVVLQPLHGKTYRTPPHEYASRMSDVFAATFGGQITVLRSDRDAEASGQELRKTLPAGFHDRIDERVSNATSALAEGSAIEAPETARPEAAHSEAARPEAAHSEAARPETAHSEAARPEAAQAETAQTEAPQSGAPQSEVAGAAADGGPVGEERPDASGRHEGTEAGA